MRRGFTLVELLVATGVFLFGFTAAMSLFLLGTRARTQADGLLRLSLAASSIVEEIRLEAGRESKADGTPADGIPFAPETYVGDGFATIASTGEAPDDGGLYPYRLQPGVWYRVLDCRDEKGEVDDRLATALRLDLLVVWNPTPDETLTMDELARRQRIDTKPEWTAIDPADTAARANYLADFMAKRGFAVRETAWIVRKASWER